MIGHCPSFLNNTLQGILIGDTGHVLMPDILYQAFRIDSQKARRADENRIEMGREAAHSLAFENDADIIKAFARADAFQARLCRDMHAVLVLTKGKKCPAWVQADMFRVLEREAMKQVFAERLQDRLSGIDKKIRPAIELSAQGNIHPSLQKAANEILSQTELYTGTL